MEQHIEEKIKDLEILILTGRPVGGTIFNPTQVLNDMYDTIETIKDILKEMNAT